jgi:penicillin-binding protein 1A
MLRFIGWLFTAGFILFMGAAAVAAYVIWDVSRDLPDYKQLAKYEPPVMTRMHAADGSLLAEYAEERRLFVPVSAVPKRLVQAYLAAEDKTFYQHHGLDWRGILNALVNYVQVKVRGTGQLIGASTITQQVAKNFLLSSEQTEMRKIKEALLVRRIENAFSKDTILELYLNEIFLGMNSYGIAAASLNYFGKSLGELELDEMAYLAALPKGPNNYHPFRHAEAARKRRNWVLKQMFLNSYITQEEMEKAQAKPFKVNPRQFGGQLFAAESFAEEVRRELVQLYGKDALAKGGYSVRTTLDPKQQLFARQALARGLISLDRKRGFRGPLKSVDVLSAKDWAALIEKEKIPADVAPWRLAVVLSVSDTEARIGLQPSFSADGSRGPERETATIPVRLLSWARKYVDGVELGPEIVKASDVLSLGDVIVVAPAATAGQWHLVQFPEIEGALVAMDPHTGRVLAMVGGFSYGASQFNRAVQAMRQPGSAFKPIVYSAALDNGYTPSSVVMDAPIEFTMPDGKTWKPKNYQDKFYGPSTLRRGIEQSRNAMTVRLANDLGMTRIADLAQRLGIYDKMPFQLSMSLGAGETTLLKMTNAYSIIDNGGLRVEATLIDRIQDRYGKTIYRHDKRDCTACRSNEYLLNSTEPELADTREAVMNPYTAYQITSMMEGVVERGTGHKLKAVGKPVAGKTGTSNDEKDAWFIGYTPDLVVGAYIGFDNPRAMGKKRTGGEVAAPIVADFMKLALKDEVAVPFRVPRGVELIPIHAKNGKRGTYGEDGVILEAFKPGDEPPENSAVIGEKQAVNAKQGEGVVLVPPGIQPETPAGDGAYIAPETYGEPSEPLTKSDGGLY